VDMKKVPVLQIYNKQQKEMCTYADKSRRE